MANTSSAKGNPASHRMGNSKRKEARASSWRRTEEAKKKGTHPTSLRRKQNEELAALKKSNFGFGQRAVRRILDGRRKDHGLSVDQLQMLVLR